MSGSLLAAFAAEVAIITYRQYAGEGVAGGGLQVPAAAPMNLPLPSSYTAPILFFGGLALIPSSGASFAGLVGWGIVVATLLNLWTPEGQIAGGLPAGSTITLTPPGGTPTTYSAGPGGTIASLTPQGPPAPTQ